MVFSACTTYIRVRGSCWGTLLVDLLHDRVEFGFKLLLLRFIAFCFNLWVALEELKSLLDEIIDCLLVLVRELCVYFIVVEGVLDLEAVVFKTISGFDLSLNFLAGKAASVISDLDFLVPH